MKKFNLIEWLSRNSHEKQSPQRFARYAAMLIMLLTLGVGQMWASHGFFSDNACGVKVNYSGSTIDEIKKNSSGASTEALGTISKLYLKEWWFAAWENTDDFTGSESGTMYYRIYPSGSASGSYTSSSKNYYNWSGWKDGSQNVWLGNNSLNVDLYSGKNPGNYIMEYYFMMGSSYLSNGSNNYKISFTVPGFSTTSKSHTFANTTVSSTKDETISFGQHYGTALTTGNCALSGTNKSEFEVRSISETGVTVRFKPSTAGTKSATLTITDAHSKTCTITISGTTQYTVTYNKGDYGTGSNVTANKVYGTDLTLRNSGDFSRTGYNHTAWNTNSAGTGGTSYSLGGSYKSEAAVTLYPTWTAKTTTITLDLNGGDAGDESVTATFDNTTLPAFTLATKTGGYNLTGYWTNTSGGTKIINSDGSFVRNTDYTTDEETPKWKHTGSTLTLHAQWNSFLSVTYDGNGNTGGDAPTDATEYASGNTVTVATTPVGFVKTGYTLTGWKTGGVTYTAGQTFTITANTTLVAQWSENKTAVTISASPAGTGTFTVNSVSGTSASVGVTTTAAVVATGATDFQFVSWAATNCSVSPTNNRSTTLTGNGSSATGTLVATFTENVASGWYLGGSSPFYSGSDATSWGTSNKGYQMTKKYRGMDGVFYRSGTVTTSGYYTIHNGTTRYRPSTGKNATFSGAGYSNKISMSNTSADANFCFGSNGTYYIIADTRGATPVIWYETTEPDRFNYHSVNVTGVENAKGTCKVNLGSTSGFETTRFANGETFYVTINGVSGWIPTITIGGNTTTFWKQANTYTASGTMSTSDIDVTISYTASYAVTFATTTGGNKITATGPNSTITTGTKVKSGTSITFTQTKTHDGYDFRSWNSASTGDGTDLGGNASGLTTSITAATTVYPIYTVHTFTGGTLDKKEGSNDGSYSVTYLATSFASKTAPTRTGYNVEGYYIETARTNKVANADGTLIANKTYTNGSKQWTYTSSIPTLFTGWTAKTYTTDNNLDKNGGDSHGKYTATYDATSIAINTTPAKTGYHVEGYYSDDECENKVATDAGALQASTAYTDASNKWNYDNNDAVLYTKWTANTYDINLNANGGAGAAKVVTVTYDAALPTKLKGGGDLTAHSRTGYTFTGYWDATSNGTKYYNADLSTNTNWNKTTAAPLYAQWSANPYTITLTQEGETGYGSAGTTSVGATFDAALPTIASLPTAANGYAFMGYYTDHNGEGTQYYDASGTKLVASYTTADDLELFAYFKKAEITNIAFGAGTVVENGSTVTVTATISPTPTGTTTVCWRILYDNGSALDPQPAFDPVTAQGNSVSFTAPAASGMYKVEAVLHTGSGCAGTDLSTRTADFQVAGSHTVTVQYHDGSGNSIKANTSVTGRPLVWSSGITAPDDIFGYIFEYWQAGDGITLSKDGSSAHNKDTAQVSTVYIKATYNGTLTAVYKPADILYFKNTMGWSNVYVYFYTSDKYWDQTYYGSGTYKEKQFCEKKKDNEGNEYDDCTKPYWDQKHGQLTRLGDTDIWYIDFGALGCADWHHLVFNANQQDNYEWFSATELVRRGDLSKGTPMFVPADKSTYNPTTKNGNAKYYNQGYWTKYIGDKTGYTLQIYNSAGNSLLKEIPLTGDENLMPMTAKADLEGTKNYKFQIRRDNSIYYGNTGTMTYANHGQGTPWAFTNFPGMCTITTTAAGDYKFTLTYSKDGSGNYELRMAVDYPISDGDYRLVYSDAVQTKPLTSAVVPHMANKDTIVSFFIRKDQSPNLRLQKATVAGDGAITWNEYPTSGTPTNQLTSAVLNTLPQDSVYNINLHMDGSSALSVTSVTPYEGDFYIRTDGVRNKWDNFRAADHLMTYSEYAEKNSGFTHYFMSHVYGGTSVKFVVANDYAPNISDTLVQQAGDAGHVDASGKLWYDASSEANIRFMWNRHDNSVGRAYLAAAKTDGSKFLVLRANSSEDMMDEDGNALLESATSGQAGYNHGAPDNSMQFVDDENWIYETTVQVKPSAYVKLYAHYHGEDFYYKGINNSTFDADNAIQILGGTGDAEKLHVVYDFKTGRLVSAWMPSGNISTERAIHADVMFLREHQGDIEQLTFSNDGKITEINTAYAVMRFNKWTLNNKSKEVGHDVLNPLLSNFERDLFYVSFPFRVNLEEVFGFGTYGKHWIIEEYDGASRAEKGFWADSPSFWKFVTNRKGKFLEPNTGYILALDLEELGESSSVWDNGVEKVELYFPSYGTMPNITSSSVTYEVPAHTCTIGPRFEGGDDRRVKDSHWNVLSVPTYVNTNYVSFANTAWTTAGDGKLGPNFLYTVNWSDNSLTATSGVGYTYKAMHAYIVQYCGNVTWSTSVSPAAAPNRNPDAPQDTEYRLELRQNDVAVDQAFVRMSDDEHVTTGFDFNYDMSKEFNKNKANIYTMVTTMMEDGPSVTQTAGNTLPLTEQTTVVPVGVKIVANGDYTFAIPEGTNGVGVTLIDNETGIRTSLSALDYTINLPAGTYNERFVLEISPIRPISTDLENTEYRIQNTDVRKVLIDNILYIVKDGVMYDARGSRVQ